jgi:hypothetical protein
MVVSMLKIVRINSQDWLGWTGFSQVALLLGMFWQLRWVQLGFVSLSYVSLGQLSFVLLYCVQSGLVTMGFGGAVLL